MKLNALVFERGICETTIVLVSESVLDVCTAGMRVHALKVLYCERFQSLFNLHPFVTCKTVLSK